uniref:Kinesin-like protein n=1 Tax=Parastrongyloides trichosuri TaxID=131310 RepID=A0A0N4ZT06_PARTI
MNIKNIEFGNGGKSCIRVGIRIRPRTFKEIEFDDKVVLETSSNTIYIHDIKQVRKYSGFDYIFGNEGSQSHIYNVMISDYILKLLLGFNCTIFAYGQTGTGKTYTIEGKFDAARDDTFNWKTDNDAGIIIRAMQHILELLNQKTCSRKKITVTYIQLYNENIYDLIGDNKKLTIYEDGKNNEEVKIKDVSEFIVNSIDDVHDILDRGHQMRQQAFTLMSSASSRSHAIFSAIVEWDEVNKDTIISRKGKLNLVDLAGSENIEKSGLSQISSREIKNINTSLLALGNVITALTEGNSYVPYRRSNLTRILKDSLGGSALTCIVAAVSPTFSNISETRSTLDYSLKAMNIKNKSLVNVSLKRNQAISGFEVLDEISRIIRDMPIINDSFLEHFSPNNDSLVKKLNNLIMNKSNIIENKDNWISINRDILNSCQNELRNYVDDIDNDVLELDKKLYAIELNEEEEKKIIQQIQFIYDNFKHMENAFQCQEDEIKSYLENINKYLKDKSAFNDICEDTLNKCSEILRTLEKPLSNMEINELNELYEVTNDKILKIFSNLEMLSKDIEDAHIQNKLKEVINKNQISRNMNKLKTTTTDHDIIWLEKLESLITLEEPSIMNEGRQLLEELHL